LTSTGRLAALTLVGALALAGCGGSGTDKPSTGGTSGAAAGSTGSSAGTGPAASSTPTSQVEVPAGVTLTKPGVKRAFGQTAHVAYEVTRQAPEGKAGKAGKAGKGKAGEGKAGEGKAGKARKVATGTVLALTVDSATKGKLSDLSGFNLTDPYQRKANYYYVRVSVKNLGKKQLGGVAVPLWGISGENTLLPPVRFTSAFAACPTEPLPAGFAPGDRFQTCLVFLSPDKGSLEGVSYRPTPTSTPIEWHGKVSAPQPDRGGRGSGKGS